MQKKIAIRLLPAELQDENLVKEVIARQEGLHPDKISGYQLLKRSLDARGKTVFYNLSVLAYINEPFHRPAKAAFNFRNTASAERSVIIIGAGPAGLFAALKFLEAGIKPIILERGKDVRARRRDLALLNKEGIVNPESNYCFGEGGAGTYSDGKLYTRSNKRGDINRILNLFVHFGAEENILYEAHPHIGTNKLPHIITAMRDTIINFGGEVHFGHRVDEFLINNAQIAGVKVGKENISADAYLLATGHSARDIFEMLHRSGILIEAKPFALGVRVEHPQELINSIQYHGSKDACLPPASYSLVQQVNDTGMFSFCMCPGGIIAPAATQPGEIVVNGWSPSKRNNPFANSGMVVEISREDAYASLKESGIKQDDPLLFLRFQQMVEKSAFEAGGGGCTAPAQRLVDFCENKISTSLPENSYLPGLQCADLKTVLPGFVHQTLAKGFPLFGRKMKGYYTNEAIVVATESRTSSPVKIPRDKDLLHHPQLKNLYPCGEGAGFAGGIVSAAMDGERVADRIIASLPAH